MRPTWAEIDLENLAFNYRLMRDFVGAQTAVMAVVKADAYGHNAVLCARKLANEAAAWLGVALPEEAFELRAANIETPILCLGGFWPGQERQIVEQRITPVVYRLDMAESLNRAAAETGLIQDVHVKIDTGMNRLGVRFDAAREFAAHLASFKNLRVDGLMTHFAAADEATENEFTSRQINLFEQAIEIFHERGFRPTWCNLANSPGALAHKSSWKNLVRVGGALYGIGKDIFPPSETVGKLRPVLSLKSKIILLKTVAAGETLGYSRTFRTARESVIATVPIGYHDGLPRSLSNVGCAIVNNCFAPVIGRVSMDLILLDVTDVPEVELWNEATFIGASADLQITAEDAARQCNTISYEITCGISARVPRRAV